MLSAILSALILSHVPSVPQNSFFVDPTPTESTTILAQDAESQWANYPVGRTTVQIQVGSVELEPNGNANAFFRISSPEGDRPRGAVLASCGKPNAFVAFTFGSGTAPIVLSQSNPDVSRLAAALCQQARRVRTS